MPLKWKVGIASILKTEKLSQLGLLGSTLRSRKIPCYSLLVAVTGWNEPVREGLKNLFTESVR